MHAIYGERSCVCGAVFRSRTKLGRHVQKWNAKAELRELQCLSIVSGAAWLRAVPV